MSQHSTPSLGEGIYLVSYPYQGERWNVEMHAYSIDDAECRLKALALGRVDGLVRERIRVPPAGGLLARLYVELKVWWLNRGRT